MGYLDDNKNSPGYQGMNLSDDSFKDKLSAFDPNMSDEDRQKLLEAYRNKFGQLPGLDASYGSTPDSLRQTPDQGLMGPPAPTPDQVQLAAPTKKASSPVSTLMGKLNLTGTTGPSIQDILSKLNSPNPELQAAIDKRDSMQDLSMIGKGVNQILGGQTHTTPSNAVWDELSKNAGQGITDIGTKQTLATEGLKQQDMASKLADEATKNDPNSSISNLYRATIEKMLGAKSGTVPKNISAAALEKQFPAFEKIFAAAESAKDRAARAEDLKAYREASLGARTDQQANTLFDKNESQFKQRILGANRLQDMVSQIKAGKLIGTKNVSRELTNEIDQLVRNNQSGGAYGDREEVAIKSLKGYLANLEQWASGHPEETIPPDFIPQIEQEANILKDSYFKAYNDTSRELQEGTQVQSKKDVYSNRTKAFNRQHGYNPDEGTKTSDVQVKLPDGRIGFIPQENLKEALKHGAKEI